MAQLAARRNTGGPGGYQRGRDGPLRREDLRLAQRRVREVRPRRFEAEECARRAGGRRGVVAVAADELLGAGAVVAGEEDQRVLPLALLAKLVEDAADLAVHPVDHRRVD